MQRAEYVDKLCTEIRQSDGLDLNGLKTVYFGGGTPALCDLRPLFEALGTSSLAAGRSDDSGPHDFEFTVELHPLDVVPDLLKTLRDCGVNRISMGVQSLDDATLAHMGRGYTIDMAERAFALVKEFFENAGIDLIVGYPSDEVGRKDRGKMWDLRRLKSWDLRHCSVYSLQNERDLENVPDDDAVLDQIRAIAAFLKELGLVRYEISNYAVPGFECRHNLAVWRGEDYWGLGDGACGRVGLRRTKSGKEEFVSADFDEKERCLFRLRTYDGLDASGRPEWEQVLQKHCQEGLLTQSGEIYRLTERGMEVCDAILLELV